MLIPVAPLLGLFQFDYSQEMLYLICATLGGSVLILQTILLLIGFGGADDFDGLGEGGDFELEGTESAFGFISVRGITAFLTFFGLAGWGGTNAGWHPGLVILVALLSGTAIMLLVGWLFSLQKHLYSEGNLHPERVVGQTARVYLRIPAHAKGKGKITVSLQGRSEQFEATTAADCGEDIATGAEVRIVRMIVPGSFEVEAL